MLRKGCNIKIDLNRYLKLVWQIANCESRARKTQVPVTLVGTSNTAQVSSAVAHEGLAMIFISFFSYNLFEFQKANTEITFCIER